MPGLELSVFSDRDIASKQADIEAALDGADVFFGSLLFDFDQVEWLRKRVAEVPLRLVFESALELMSTTQVRSFEMAPGGKKAGPPPAVKKLLGLFGSQREEDRLAGYLSFLKVGPKVLKFLPMKKAQDLRAWCGVCPVLLPCYALAVSVCAVKCVRKREMYDAIFTHSSNTL